MNLFDLVGRVDRAIVFEGDAPKAVIVATPIGKQRAVLMAAGSRLRIIDAHQFTALSVLSPSLGWSLLDKSGATTGLSMALTVKKPKAMTVALMLRTVRRDDGSIELRIDWPQQIVLADEFDLDLTVRGDQPLTLLVGPLVNMRHHLLPHARGIGVEVGPGLRPIVLPAEGVQVTYVEEQDPHEWLNLYNKAGEKPTVPPKNILDLYVRSSAVALDGFGADSVDFIFSNHVFEHLPNPMQVLRNWLAVTRPGGVIMGVMPDPRFTFDCRQPPTTVREALREEDVGGHRIGIEKYQRWCRYTEPRHVPEDLIRRGYSIHVNFFTPETFRELSSVLEARSLIDRTFVFTAPNHKDFAFLLRKALPSR